MAGDWIKIDHGLHEKPEVHYLSATLGIDPFMVVGMLVKVWEWFDRNSENGYVANVTFASLDRIVARNGFAEAMNFAGWLDQQERGLSLPKFDRHNGKSAKNRALSRDRMAKKRYADVTQKFEKVTPREEKRREKEKSSRPTQFERPTHVRANGVKTLKELLPEQEQKALADRLRSTP